MMEEFHLKFPFCSEIFFFKQKTAYEIGVRLVGSEMCIRDRFRTEAVKDRDVIFNQIQVSYVKFLHLNNVQTVSYTHLTLPTNREV